jgi:hypothetical protein
VRVVTFQKRTNSWRRHSNIWRMWHYSLKLVCKIIPGLDGQILQIARYRSICVYSGSF